MSPGVPTKVIAANVGLTAFALALVAGLAADNPLESIVTRALVAMVVCHVVGYGVGTVMERALRDSLEAYKVKAAAAQAAAQQAARAARESTIVTVSPEDEVGAAGERAAA